MAADDARDSTPNRAWTVLWALLATPRQGLERFRKQFGASSVLSVERLLRARDLLMALGRMMHHGNEEHGRWLDQAWAALQRIEAAPEPPAERPPAEGVDPWGDTVTKAHDRAALARPDGALPFRSPPASDADDEAETTVMPTRRSSDLREQLRSEQGEPTAPQPTPTAAADDPDIPQPTTVLPDIDYAALRQQIANSAKRSDRDR